MVQTQETRPDRFLCLKMASCTAVLSHAGHTPPIEGFNDGLRKLGGWKARTHTSSYELPKAW